MKKPIYKRWWFIVLAVIIGIGVIGAMSGGDGNPAENGETSVAEEKQKIEKDTEKEDENLIDDFEIIDEFSVEKDQFSYYIVGKVKNKKGKELTYAQITFNLFDKDGAQIGTAIDNINYLDKDGIWKFKAMALENQEEIDSYKIAGIEAF